MRFDVSAKVAGSMNGQYTVFKRDERGMRGEMITGFSRLEIMLEWLKASKLKIKGKSAGAVPLEDGNQIVIYRNGYPFMSGIIEKIEMSCDYPASDVRDWEASGRDLSLIFGWRQVLADPVEITFEDETYDQVKDSAWNRLLHYINNNIGEGTIWERQIFPLTLPNREDIGETALSAYKSKRLDEVLEEIGDPDSLVPVLERDDKSGDWRVTIAESRDMTKSVFFSPNYGNVLKWKRWSSIPECNAVWVFSGDYSKGRLYVYAEDTESIEHYGRIEKIICKSDIKPYEEEEEEETLTSENSRRDSGFVGDIEPEDPVTEPDDEDETITGGNDLLNDDLPVAEEEEEEPKLTEEDVLELLEQEAKSYLKDHQRKITWTVEAAETRHMAFMDQWQIGDRVTCILDGQRFAAQITKIKVTYEKGTEKVEPTIGDVENGLFGELFRLLRGLDERVTQMEK